MRKNKTVLTESGEKRLRAYFSSVRNYAKKGEKFPVDFDDVWPLAYKNKSDALVGLKKHFEENTDYIKMEEKSKRKNKKSNSSSNELRGQDLQVVDNGIFYENAQNAIINELQNETPEVIDNEENEKINFGGGQRTVKYCLTVACFEHFIVRKVPAVFEVYRQFFYNAADLMERTELWNNVKERGKLERGEYTTVLMEHGVSAEGRGFAVCTDSMYSGAFGKTAKEIRKERNLRKHQLTRDGLNTRELAKVNISEYLAKETIVARESWGVKECARDSREAGAYGSEVIDAYLDKLKKEVEQKKLLKESKNQLTNNQKS
jgi:hypothetical protein